MTQNVFTADLVVEHIEAEGGLRLRLAIELSLKVPDLIGRFEASPAHSPVNASRLPSRTTRASLGAGTVRYTFTVTDFHRLPLAGLPAHPSTASNRKWQVTSVDAASTARDRVSR